MGSYYTPVERYREIQFQTADQGKLILSAYEAAIRYAKKGLECLQSEDQMGKSQWLIRAYEIVSELHRSLKPVEGGDRVIKALDESYAFIEHQITRANVVGDKEALQNALHILEGLRDTWKEILRVRENSSSSINIS